jgi:hypothetical protein
MRPDCKPCQSEYQKGYRARNVEKIRAKSTDYYAQNREYLKAYRKQYVLEHADELKAKRAARYAEIKGTRPPATDEERARRRTAEKAAYAAMSANERRARHLKRYGITLEHFDAMLAVQGHRCANRGCLAIDPGKRGWHVDHDHATGKVRGLLCGPCNLMLGQARDSIRRLLGAVVYLGSEAEAVAVLESLRVGHDDDVLRVTA